MRAGDRRRVASAAGLGAMLLALGLASAAGAAWRQPVGGAAPINREADRDAAHPSLTEVAGLPYLAWSEADEHGVEQIRVARLRGDGGAWERPGDAASPINVDPAKNAEDPTLRRQDPGDAPCVAFGEASGAATQIHMSCLATATEWKTLGDSPDKDPTAVAAEPSLTLFGNETWVAWSEVDSHGVNQVRAAKLPPPGDHWVRVPDTDSPINEAPGDSAFGPSLLAVGGDLYVAWSEVAAGVSQVHVKKLDAAGTAWEKVGDVLNESSIRDAVEPSMADVGGVPYVAWVETNEPHFDQVRVARLAGSAWQLVAPTSPLNKSFQRNAEHPSLTAIGGVPYVAWSEPDEHGIEQLRVARLNGAGDAWERVVDTESPINAEATRPGGEATLTAIGGFPYVGWSEEDKFGHEQIRVGRLEPEFLAAGATGLTPEAATLTAEARTYGLPFPIGFDFGTGLERELAPEPAPAGAEVVTVTRPLTGLTENTAYQLRPFATAGVPAPRVVGPTVGFTTPTPSLPVEPTEPATPLQPPKRPKKPGSSGSPAGGGPGSGAPPRVAPPSVRIVGARINSRRGVVRLRFRGSGGVTGFRCALAKAGKRAAFRPCRSPRIYRRLKRGRYLFQVRAADPALALSIPVRRRFRIRG